MSKSTQVTLSTKHKLVLFVIAVTLTLGLTNCVSRQQTSLPSIPPRNTEGEISKWLRQVPCASPCWAGITPGKTNGTEAAEILKSSQFAENIQMGAPSMFPDLGSIQWNWIGSNQGGKIYYHAQTAEQPVYSIEVNYPTPLTLQQVMQAFGEPTHIIAIRNRDTIVETGPNTPSPYQVTTYNIEFIYLDRGFRLPVANYKMDSHGNPILDGATLVEGPRFFVPSLEGLTESEGGSSLTKFMIPWSGFKDFGFYCRDRLTEKTCM